MLSEIASLGEMAPEAEVHLWRADLDREDWPDADGLPADERLRAARILSPGRRRRWVASRWALRTALAAHLDQVPRAIDLGVAARGKPRLEAASALRFNVSHSAGVALIAVTSEREVGVDVERLGDRPRDFYDAWVRREAVAKCFGSGLGHPLPQEPVEVSPIDLGAGWAAALALAGDVAAALRHRRVSPAPARC